MAFDPCRTTAGNCPLAKDGRHIRFHQWEHAIGHVCGRAKGSAYRTGRLDRYRVYFDGKHWRTRNVATGEED